MKQNYQKLSKNKKPQYKYKSFIPRYLANWKKFLNEKLDLRLERLASFL